MSERYDNSTALLVLAYRGVSLPSRLIRWQTWSPYSHVALGYLDAPDQPWTQAPIVEAWTHGGVRQQINPFLGHTRGTRIDAFCVDGATPERARQAWAYALACVGRPYDWCAVARFLPRFGKDNPERLFCSELVMEACASAGLRLLERIDAARVAPGHLVTSPLLRYLGSADDGAYPPLAYVDRECE